MQITIQRVTSEVKAKKDHSGTFEKITVTDTSGQSYGSFDPKLKELGPGSVIEAEIEVSGKYKNIGKNWIIVTKAEPVSAASGGTQGGKQQTAVIDTVSSERQFCLKCACDVIQYTVTSENESNGIEIILGMADQFYAWLKGKRSQPESAQKPHEDIAGDGKVTRTGPELFNYALKHGYTLDQIKAKLGVSKPTEIQDVDAAYKLLYP